MPKQATRASPWVGRWGHTHREIRREVSRTVMAGRARCARCGEFIRAGEPWDLGHIDGDPSRYAGPEHRACNRATAGRRPTVVVLAPEPEPEGLHPSDPRFDVPWLARFRRRPADAAWPRLMSVPHARAVGSLGPEFIRWAERRSGRKLRWWQRLAATRMLEVDAEGRLCWDVVFLSVARQLGKSWLLRELNLWRMNQAERFGEPQDVLHTGNNLGVCLEVQRPARAWAKLQADYRVTEGSGKEKIERVECGSRWLVLAKSSVYGFSASLACVDEAWDVKLGAVEEGLEPTMAEREQPQLYLVSTAHRATTSLMLSRRRLALADFETGEGVLLLEWSAPRGAPIDDVATWRAASAHWSKRRQDIVARQLASALENTLEDPTEPDPIAAFRSQWLNEWPAKLAEPSGKTEDLFPPGLWADRAVEGVTSTGPVWVAVEDDFGFGAAVAVVGRLDDGRLEVDGWLCRDWDTAIADVQRLDRPVRELLVGASLHDRIPPEMVPRPRLVGSTQTRVGLSLIRDLVAGAQLVHDEVTEDVDGALASTQVRTTMAGLIVAASSHSHLVRAVVWAIGAAHKPTPTPAIR
jgi:hypothetical protein